MIKALISFVGLAAHGCDKEALQILKVNSRVLIIKK